MLESERDFSPSSLPATLASSQSTAAEPSIYLSWLRTEVELDVLTLKYSRSEQRLMRSEGDEFKKAEMAHAVVCEELATVDALRDVLIDAIRRSRVQSLPEAWEKLLVLQSRLAGEGGEHFELLNDVLRLFFAGEPWARSLQPAELNAEYVDA
ncbi:MAG: hypothetical protein EON90_02350 [Brevundimonas sp.]|nr:MAG: hypothetical protein EON90_02350 [Brevundimonas sp.]